MERKEISIPEMYYLYGMPIRTDYDKGDNMGFTYKEGGEKAFELASAFGGSIDKQYTTIHLLSPYIVGWDLMGKEKELVSVDIKNKKIIILIKD